jgi:hypothetical protein
MGIVFVQNHLMEIDTWISIKSFANRILKY